MGLEEQMFKMMFKRLKSYTEKQAKAWNVKQESVYLMIFTDNDNPVIYVRTSENKELKEKIDF